MCFEGAGYLPAGAGETYGVDGFRFGHDGARFLVRNQLAYAFLCILSWVYMKQYLRKTGKGEATLT